VSVVERTWEIGVLKAIGARRSHILLESLTITLSGGMLGLLLAAGLMQAPGTLPLLGTMFQDTAGRGDIQLGLSVPAVVVASLVLVGVGLVAGLVPAVRAARLDPVAAIRGD
jgi:putative ABC transport system permease protein